MSALISFNEVHNNPWESFRIPNCSLESKFATKINQPLYFFIGYSFISERILFYLFLFFLFSFRQRSRKMERNYTELTNWPIVLKKQQGCGGWCGREKNINLINVSMKTKWTLVPFVTRFNVLQEEEGEG